MLNDSTYNYDDNDITIYSPTRKGYTFIGWTYSGQTTPTLEPLLSHNSTGNKTYTANWKANLYEITYDVNGGDELTDNTQEISFADYAYLLKPTRPGYKFLYWTYNGNEYKEGTYKEDKNITLIAVWERIEYTISYDLNGGTNNELNTSSYNYDCEDIVIYSPTRTGYTFTGWTYIGQETPIIDPVLKHNSTDNITYIANWKAYEYTITYDVDG